MQGRADMKEDAIMEEGFAIYERTREDNSPSSSHYSERMSIVIEF